MPAPLNAQTRPELIDLTATLLLDALTGSNTAAKARQLAEALIYSAYLHLSDQLSPRDIAGLTFALAGKADLNPLTGLVRPNQLPVPSFAALTDHPFANALLFGLLFPLLNGSALYQVITYAAAVDAASDGQLDPGKFYRITNRTGGATLDVVLPAAGATAFSAEEAYTVGVGSDAPPFLPVSYDLATDTATERTAGLAPPTVTAAVWLGDPADFNVLIGEGGGNTTDGKNSVFITANNNELTTSDQCVLVNSDTNTLTNCQRLELHDCNGLTLSGVANAVYRNNKLVFAAGIPIITAPNGTHYKITVDNAGVGGTALL
jgi:hypothetical protein